MLLTIAQWAHDLRFANIPERVRRATRYQTMNVVASLHASRRAEAAEAVARVVRRWAKPGPCTVIPTGEKTALHEAVLVNAARSMALDYDDYLIMGHTGHSAVLGALAVGESLGASSEEVLVAQVIANELGGRFGASCVLGPQNGQSWSFIHAVEGAALTSRLLGLGVEQTAHALAIALYQPPFSLWPGFMNATSKELTAALPTVNGIIAAELAAEGMTGALDILEHPTRGFFRTFAYVPLPQVFESLGRGWVSDTLAYKRYPGCAYVDTTLDAIFNILSQMAAAGRERPTSRDVRDIRVSANLLTVAMDNLSGEYDDGGVLTPIGINFSARLNIGVALRAAAHGGAQMHPRWLEDNVAEVRGFADKVDIQHDWDKSAEVIHSFEQVLGGGVLGQLRDPANLVKVAFGVQHHLGGPRRSGLRVRDLLHPGRLLRVGKRLRGEAPGPLSAEGLAAFRMPLPVEVTLRTHDGAQFIARQDFPDGSPGIGDYGALVEDKMRRESLLGGKATEHAIESSRADGVSPADLASACCVPPGVTAVTSAAR